MNITIWYNISLLTVYTITGYSCSKAICQKRYVTSNLGSVKGWATTLRPQRAHRIRDFDYVEMTPGRRRKGGIKITAVRRQQLCDIRSMTSGWQWRKLWRAISGCVVRSATAERRQWWPQDRNDIAVTTTPGVQCRDSVNYSRNVMTVQWRWWL